MDSWNLSPICSSCWTLAVLWIKQWLDVLDGLQTCCPPWSAKNHALFTIHQHRLVLKIVHSSPKMVWNFDIAEGMGQYVTWVNWYLCPTGSSRAASTGRSIRKLTSGSFWLESQVVFWAIAGLIEEHGGTPEDRRFPATSCSCQIVSPTATPFMVASPVLHWSHLSYSHSFWFCPVLSIPVPAKSLHITVNVHWASFLITGVFTCISTCLMIFAACLCYSLFPSFGSFMRVAHQGTPCHPLLGLATVMWLALFGSTWAHSQGRRVASASSAPSCSNTEVKDSEGLTGKGSINKSLSQKESMPSGSLWFNRNCVLVQWASFPMSKIETRVGNTCCWHETSCFERRTSRNQLPPVCNIQPLHRNLLLSYFLRRILETLAWKQSALRRVQNAKARWSKLEDGALFPKWAFLQDALGLNLWSLSLQVYRYVHVLMGKFLLLGRGQSWLYTPKTLRSGWGAEPACCHWTGASCSAGGETRVAANSHLGWGVATWFIRGKGKSSGGFFV